MFNCPTVPSRTINILYDQENSHKGHPSLSKDKRKQFLKTSKQKLQSTIIQNTLRQCSSNVPTFKIDLSRKSYDKIEKVSLEKCKKQLSSQKELLIRQLEKKEQKMIQLRETYRKIQTSKGKNIQIVSQKPHQFKDIQSDKSTKNQNPSTRRTAHSPHRAFHRSQRTMLFPSKT